MSDNTSIPHPENEEIPCPACRICPNKQPCRFKRCEKYLDWFDETWKELRRKFGVI